MRICLYTTTALPKVGGQEFVVDALARAYNDRGHETVVLAPHPRARLTLNDAALPYRVVRHPRIFSTRYFVRWHQRWLLKLHREWPFDAIHCHGLYPGGYLCVLAAQRLPGVPVVITSHGDSRPDHELFAKPGLRQRFVETVNRADGLVAIGEYLEHGYRQLSSQAAPIHRIPNGVHLRDYAQPAPRPANLPAWLRSGSYVLFLGRLDRRKGVDVLLEACAHLPTGSRPPLVVVGDGDEREPLEAQSRALGLTETVHFAGRRQGADKIWCLQNARFAVAPSRTWEGMPLVVLECYAAGCPVVASSVSGLSEHVLPGQTGLLVPPEQPEPLAAAIGAIYADDAQLAALRAGAGRRAQEFDWGAIAERHLRLLGDLCAQRAQAA